METLFDRNIKEAGRVLGLATMLMLTLNGCESPTQPTNTKNKESVQKTVPEIGHNEREKTKLNEKYITIDSTLKRDPTLITEMEKERNTADSIVNSFSSQIDERKSPGDTDLIEKIIFKKGAEKKDERGTYLEINGKKYYKREEGCNGDIYIPLCQQDFYTEENGKTGKIIITKEGEGELEGGTSGYIGRCNNGIPNGKGLLISYDGGYEYGEFKDGIYTGIGLGHEEAGAYDASQGYEDYYNNNYGEVVRIHTTDKNKNSQIIYFHGTRGDRKIIQNNDPRYSIYGGRGTEIFHNSKGTVMLPDGTMFKSNGFDLINPYNEKANLVIEGEGLLIKPDGKKIIGYFNRGKFYKIQDLEINQIHEPKEKE